MNRGLMLSLVGLLVVVLSGCTLTEMHTAGGSLTGAAMGGLLTGNRQGALIGALAGGAIGNVHGQNQQQHANTQRELQNTRNQMNQLQQQANQTTVWVTNSNGSKTPVVLSKATGGQWVGPRGELYTNLPSEDQLKAVYGF